MQKKRKINIVIDANWYISACINRNSRQVLYHKILKKKHIHVYYSDELLAEFEGVISREKFRKIISLKQANRLIQFVLLFVRKVEIKTIPKLVRDSNDDYLLGICESCKADYLITGDKDLLVLKSYNNTLIFTMGEFLNLINKPL